MRATGKRYMRIDHLVDERMDPHVSSVAAARLLQENYEETRAWPLAITAYNHGAGGMKRAVKQLGTRDIGVIVDRYESRTFGFASKNFYAEFLAALDVERDPTRFFGPIAKDPPDDGEVVVLEHNYEASTLARTFGLSLERLREHNPALLAPIWNGQRYVPRGHGLRVPRGTDRPTARVALADVPDTERYEEQPRDREYRVRRGDTLGRIARRYGVSESQIMRLNHLKSRNHLRVGQVLEIPGPAASVASTSPPPDAAAPRPVAREGVYRVQPGDTVSVIAQRFGVSSKDLLATNRLRDARHLRAGQLLEIPEGSSTARPAAPGRPAKAGVYTVRKGDTLHGIAQRFGVSAREIASLNGITRPNQIRPGQILHVPGGEAPPSS
jgi:membrane-bound lytic murein transglycosylase D